MLKRIFQQLIAAARNVQPKQALLYAAVFCAFFFITFYLTFPFDTIKNLAITEIEARTGSKVTVASLSPLRMSGMEVRGVRMTSAQDPMRIIADIDLARFRLHLLPVFRGRVIVDYDLVAYGGGFSGVYEQRSAGRAAMAVNFKDLDLQKYNFAKLIEDYGEMNLAGGISGHFSLYFDRQNRRNNQGDLDLYIDGMKITQARVLGNEIPDVNFKPSSIKLDFRSTGFTIEEWELEADNLSVSMVGRITLAEKMKSSRIAVTLKAKPSEKLMDKFQELAFLQSPDDDGWYNIKINGPLSKPSIKVR